MAIFEGNWGGLNHPQDPQTIMRALDNFAGKDGVVICELGVDRGETGNRMFEYLLHIGAVNVKYYGVDDRSLTIYEGEQGHEIGLMHAGMYFLQGDRAKLSEVPPLDFGFVDACHCAECVMKDGIAMSRAVKNGGYMAFHDTSLLVQYPNPNGMRDNAWQHYSSGTAIRPLNVVEGITTGRAMWDGSWDLVDQDGDRLAWGGIRVYRKG